MDFNHATWSEGRGGFGYGDDDDVTILPTTTSFYLRIQFDIIDLTHIGAAMFHIDYDDAFIAFINDKEVARSGGLSDAHPSYNTFSTDNHEATMYQGGVPSGYSLKVSDLRQGANILAIQVHNVDNSSDMSAIPFLSFGLTTSERRYRPTPNWFQAPFVFQSSNLPIVSINTNDREIPNEPKITAQMGIIQNEAGRNSLQDDFNHYNGFIGIERRGNASQSYDVVRGKWSYTFETRNADGSNNNVALLGMPKDNDWILTADFIDKTLMRNALAYQISRSIGRWAPRTRHVELVLNGNYEGVYLLVEKIKADNNRVNIARMDSTDISGENVTGGYIWDIQQADGTDIDFGERRVLKYPKADQVQPEQLAYIRDYDDEFRSVMQRSYYADPTRGYQKYIDVSSFVDEIVVQEATKNSDAYGWSGFFYKERNGKIFAGPAWDFDQALANSTHMDGDRVQMWMIENCIENAGPAFWEKLWETPAFKRQVADTWVAYRKGPLKMERLFAFIDSLAVYLDEAQQRNFTRWPYLGVPIWRSTAGAENRNTYEKEVDYMKDYLLDHIEWMDAELSLYTSVLQQETGQSDVALKMKMSPNPMRGNATFHYSLQEDGHVTIRIHNILGQEVA
ncbi:hypothetical protein EH222_02795, partial [candidate division KSB1 bacterium]